MIPMIPQLLHWVWPRDGAVTSASDAALRSWHDHHPTWRHLFWTSQPDSEQTLTLLRELNYEVRPLPLLVNHRLYSSLGCHSDGAHKENFPHETPAIVASIEIVARYGGVCPPLGDHCVGNVEPLLQGVRLFTRDSALLGSDFYRCLADAALPLYGAVPNHPALWNLVRDLKNSALTPDDCSCAIAPGSLAELLHFRLGRHPDLVTFPAMAFESELCTML